MLHAMMQTPDLNHRPYAYTLMLEQTYACLYFQPHQRFHKPHPQGHPAHHQSHLAQHVAQPQRQHHVKLHVQTYLRQF